MCHYFLPASFMRYLGVANIDHGRKEVAVRAGTLLKDLNAELRHRGLALINLPTLSDQTIGGALAVGKPIDIKDCLEIDCCWCQDTVQWENLV